MNRRATVLMVVGLLVLAGCSRSGAETEQPAGESGAQIVLFNIKSAATEDPHAVTMALQLAGHALDDGRQVALFFNVRGVTVPTTDLPEDLAFRAKPIKALLTALIEKGAQVHVCPHCMNALGVEADELIAGAFVTNRDRLFSMLGTNTVVFSY
jgi:sulfur relay (sulfurtransferase) complex TusBCD TusD component (DsrE family)